MLYVYVLRPLFRYPWRVAATIYVFLVWLIIGLIVDPTDILQVSGWRRARTDLRRFLSIGRFEA